MDKQDRPPGGHRTRPPRFVWCGLWECCKNHAATVATSSWGTVTPLPLDGFLILFHLGHRRRPEQTQGQRPTCDQQLSQRFVHMSIADDQLTFAVLFRGEYGRLAQQLANERGTDAFGAADDP